MRLSRILCLLVLASVATVATAPPAAATIRKHEDKQRGFRIQISDTFEQIPPKLTAETAYVVGDWYLDKAKYAGSSPEFQIFWFATPKAGPAVTPKGDEKSPSAAKPPNEAEKAKQAQEDARPKTLEAAFDPIFQWVTRSKDAQSKDLWKSAKKAPTHTPGLDIQWVEVNSPDDKRRARGAPYLFFAKTRLDRPEELIDVGFVGMATPDVAKDVDRGGRLSFLDITKTFEDLAKIATDSRNTGAQQDLDENDPEKFREAFKRTKMIAGWSCYDTPHYIVMYPDKKGSDDDVDPALAKSIGVQMESLRANVYEKLFPADKPVRAISVIRCCKDQGQYFSYGGPQGSAGYWYAPGKELVFYEMDRKRRGSDTLRVLYHEGFHQYIYYSVGDMDPHQWFNEGHGDYFFGFNSQDNGKWERASNAWRKDKAKAAKREHKFPDLWTWLHWTHAQYYGQNKSGVPIGDNYALGWSFVYFLRTTKKPEYQGVLDRYFITLKGCVTLARETLEAEEKARKEAEEKARKEAPAAPPAADGKDPGAQPKPPGGDATPPAPVPPESPVNPPVPPGPDGPVVPPVPPGPDDPVVPPGPDGPVVPPVPPGPDDEPPVVPPVPPGPDTPAPGDPPKPADPPKADDPPAPPQDPVKPPTPADPPQPPAPSDPVKPPAPAPTDPPPAPPADPTKPPAPPATPPDPTKPSDPSKPSIDPKKPPFEDPRRKAIFNKQLWLDKALIEAFKGVDMKQLEKDWLDAK